MWVVVQSLWLLRCVAAVWLSVTVCSACDRTLTLLFYAKFDWLYRNTVSVHKYRTVFCRIKAKLGGTIMKPKNMKYKFLPFGFRTSDLPSSYVCCMLIL